MAAARRAHPQSTPAAASQQSRRLSLVAHPARELVEPDADGFYEVRSYRRWSRRSPPKPSRPVPSALHGLCFNCLASTHVKANYVYPARCFNCFSEGHQAFNNPLLPRPGKRGHSPPGGGGDGHRVVAKCSGHRRVASDDTTSARSVSTRRSTSVPRCCAPPTPPARPPQESLVAVLEASRPAGAPETRLGR